MNYTTESILDKLQEEKEENTFVSKQLLDETNKWIDIFTEYPNVEFDLIGDSEQFLILLENNKLKIEETVYAHFYGETSSMQAAATEEEAGVLEGYIEISEEPLNEEPVFISGRKKTPTLTVSFDELYDMFAHIKNIVDEHTDHIQMLQKEIEIYKNPALLPPPAPAIPVFTETFTAPALYTAPSLQETPPALFGETIEELESTDIYTHQENDESPIDEFDTFEEIQQPAPATTVKPKFDKKKKIVLAIMIAVALSGTAAVLFMPTPGSKQTASQMQPPATINTQAIALPAPMKNISTAKPTPTATPAPAPAVTPAPVQPKSEPAKIESKYYDNMTVYVKAANDNTIHLNKNEQVAEIQGQDTENWNFNNNPESNTITFAARTNKLKNTIIIKTNKKTYTINLVSSYKGKTQINLTK